MDIISLSQSKNYANQVASGIGSMRADDATATLYFTLLDTGEEVAVHLPKPADGVGIASWVKTKEEIIDGRKVETYTVTYTNNTKITMSITNGKDGVDGQDGVGITNFAKTKEEVVSGRTVKTYTVTFSNGTTFEIPVTDGKDGQGSGGGGASSADEVSYTNESFSDIENVEEALNKLFSKVYYIAPSVSSFTAIPAGGNREIGQKVSSVSFAWTYNKDIVSQTLTNCTIETSDRSATYDTEFGTNKSFTITGKDDTNATASKTISYSFLPKVYYGSKALATIDSAYILGLSNSELKSSRSGNYTINIASGEYGILALPASYGTPNCKIGGFDTDLTKVTTFDLTNASGYTQSYNVYRTPNPSLGNITLVIS